MAERVNIYVQLLDEGVDVWRPVEATALGTGAYRLEGRPPSEERWEFQPGEIVIGETRELSGGPCLVAIRSEGSRVDKETGGRRSSKSSWTPIAESEMRRRLAREVSELPTELRDAYAQVQVPLRQERIRRGDVYGDEKAYVVAERGGEAIFFDDVEDGFDISALGPRGLLSQGGASQFTLAQALFQWFPYPAPRV